MLLLLLLSCEAFSQNVIYKASIADLESYSGTTTTIAVTDPLQGGIFNLVTGSYTVDNGLIFPATGLGSGHYWQRQYNAESGVNVQWFGVVGDGSTNVTANMNTAIYSCSQLKQTLILPEGTYIVGSTRSGPNGTILRLYDNVFIRGVNEKAIIKIADNYTTGGDYILFGPYDSESLSNIFLNNFTIDGNAANNFVVSSAGSHIRRAYQVWIKTGDNLNFEHLNIINSPGRNVIVLGNNTNHLATTNINILFNKFTNVGGAIYLNRNQSDHSTIFCQSTRGVVGYNTFSNDSLVNPLNPGDTVTTSKVVTALEIHGKNLLVIGNKVTNYTHGGNVVAYVDSSVNNVWCYNTFYNITKLGLSLWSVGHKSINIKLENNIINMSNAFNSATGGIYQSTATSNTTAPYVNLTVSGNTVYSSDTTARSNIWNGIDLCAVDGGKVINNTVKNIQANGINIVSSVANLDIKNIMVSGNTIENTGFNTVKSLVFGIYVNNTGNSTFSRINIDGNNIIRPGYISYVTMRGIRFAGSGPIVESKIGGLNTFSNIADPTTLVSNIATNNIGFSIVPRHISWVSTADPTSGIFVNGNDLVDFTDANVAAYVGKTVTQTGGGYSSIWAPSTVYPPNTWVLLSTGKVIEYLTGGTSGSSEPAPSILGAKGTDGTATYRYRAAQKAIFANYGNNGVPINQTFKAITATNTITVNNSGQSKLILQENNITRSTLGLSTVDGNLTQLIRYNSSGTFLSNYPQWDNTTGYYYPVAGIFLASGSGTPEGSVTANPGSEYTDYSSGVKYLKKTGTSNTGWFALPILISKHATASGTGSLTTITIPHGLSGISSSSTVYVTAKNSASANFSYVTVDATNVNINYTTAPASGTNNLSYDLLVGP